MKITILCVGKIKESYIKDAIDDYKKRLSRYIKLDILEIQDEKIYDDADIKQINLIKDKEGKLILKKINKSNKVFVILLDIKGKNISSEEFSKFIKEKMIKGISHIYFIIGGPFGVSDIITKRADFLLSFSKMTFTNQLSRIILLEQIYRIYKIINKEPYHK